MYYSSTGTGIDLNISHTSNTVPSIDITNNSGGAAIKITKGVLVETQ